MKRIFKKTALLTAIAVLLVVCVQPAGAAWSEFRSSCDQVAAPVRCAVVYDMTNNILLYAKNADEHISVASLTKVLNACTAARYLKAGDVITVGQEICLISSEASVAPVECGERYTFKQLLHALLLPSGCDAAYVLAAAAGRKAAGDAALSAEAAIDVFVGEMNRYMEKLGCRDSRFTTPDGQDKDGQYTTCRDYLRVLRAAMQNKLIRSVVGKASYSCRDQGGKYHKWHTTNDMVNKDSPFYYPGAIGIKTGSTSWAGYCLALAAERDGRTLISLVTGADPLWIRYDVTGKLLDVLFSSRILGDVDGDNRVTPADARLTMCASVGLETTDACQLQYGDMDGDGSLSPADARLVLRAAVGLECID